jgi:hypothetical protein
MFRTTACALAALALASASASAGLITTRTSSGTSASLDGVLAANEYGPGNANLYTGGGAGFGGTLGGSQMYMNSDASNLYIGIQLGNAINDNVVVYLNTRDTGGFNSSTQMDDASDPGRGRSSDPMSAGTVNLPIFAQYSFVFGQFGAVLFELSPNGTPHTFKSFSGQFTGNAQNFREYSLSLADLGGALGSRSYIDWLAVYTSDSGYMSDETVPFQDSFTGLGNPGFDNNGRPADLDNWDRLEVVPAPSAIALLGLGGLVAARRRRA